MTCWWNSFGRWYSVVGTANVLRAGRSLFHIPFGLRHFVSFPWRSDWLWGPPSLLLNGHRSSFSVIKLPGGVDYSLLSSPRLRMSGAELLFLPVFFVAWTGTNSCFTAVIWIIIYVLFRLPIWNIGTDLRRMWNQSIVANLGVLFFTFLGGTEYNHE